MGGSTSTSSSVQAAEAYLAQTVSGSCNITCQNIASGINIDIINTVIGGGINLTQTCSVDASCMISSSSDATSDILFKATNSTNAANASNLFSGSIFNFDTASSMSRQNIKQKIIQNTTQTCKLASLNQLSDVSILAANSAIGGSINIGQTGSTSGQCQLQNNMSAAASATAMASNSAQSGKDKKGQKKGSSAVLITIAGIAVLIIIVFIIGKLYTSERDGNTQTAEKIEAAQARAIAGCAYGSPITNSKGEVIIDPATNHAICPHEPSSPVSPQIPLFNPMYAISPSFTRGKGGKKSSSSSDYGSPSSASPSSRHTSPKLLKSHA
jgi:hypothetical protein